VKSPRGFGRNYFSLSSILAHSVAHKIEANNYAFSLLFPSLLKLSKEDDDSPPIELTVELKRVDKRAKSRTYCNCFFKIKARLVLLLNPQKPLLYIIEQGSFCTTGIHPPLCLNLLNR